MPFEVKGKNIALRNGSNKTRTKAAIPDFGVSTTILNPVDIFRRWYKFKFGLLRGHVESRHFAARRQHFYFLYVFLGITG